MVYDKLSEHISLIGGGTPNKSIESYWKGDIPWASVKDMKGNYLYATVDSITESGVENSATRIIPKENVIIATRMAVGKVAINNIDLAINQDLKAIYCKGDLDKKYLFYFLKSKANYFEKVSSGATVKGIKIEHIKELQIPLPPLPIQKKIAHILDAADSYRQQTKALIDKYDELAQSLFLDMFGDPVKNEKGWEKVPTITYCDCIVPGRDKPKSFTGDFPWITTGDLNYLGFTSKSRSDIGLTSKEIDQVRARVIPKGSVIMTCVGDLGLISINTDEVVMNQQLHAFICRQNINNVFLMYNLSYQKPYMNKMASSTTVPYMNKTIANNTPTIVPPIDLQNQFSDKIKAIEAQKERATASLLKSEELFQSLLQKAFKGEIVG